MGDSSFTASSKPVMPECVNVESPITHTAGNKPASAAPFAMVMDAPMSTQELMVLNGGKSAKRIAANVGEHPTAAIFINHFVQGIININVSATLAQRRRPVGQNTRNGRTFIHILCQVQQQVNPDSIPLHVVMSHPVVP
jgi:hypothetical protein